MKLKMKMKGLRWCLITVLLGLLVSMVSAGELDVLLEKLVEKGILTPAEAQQVMAETREEIAKEVARGMESGLPAFVRDTKFKGDFRLRYQWDETKTASTDTDRQRGRFRARFGFETPVNEKTKFGFRLATGGREQTSTNQTMDDAFVGKGVYIDQAYVNWQPSGYLAVAGGKMPNPYFCTDLVWDTDINLEGAVCLLTPQLKPVQPYFTLGVFSVDESSNWSADPALLGVQAGFSTQIAEKPFKFGLSYYDFMSLKGKVMQQVSPGYVRKTNTNYTIGTDLNCWQYDYQLLDVNLEFTPFTLPLATRLLPLKLYGNYLENMASDVRDKTGWLIGFSVGGVKNRGDWEFGYNYRVSEGDCAPDIFVDSDFHGGGTNAKGSKLMFKIGLARNAAFGITYFDAAVKDGAPKDVRMLQADLEVKF